MQVGLWERLQTTFKLHDLSNPAMSTLLVVQGANATVEGMVDPWNQKLKKEEGREQEQQEQWEQEQKEEGVQGRDGGGC